MGTPKFNDRPNYHLRYNYNDGRGLKIDQDFWISRSTAVDGIVLASTDDGLQVLTAKRSEKMCDEAGKYCIPCGYLNYDETRHEAMIREVYEETSLYLPDYEKMIIFDNNKEAIIIKDNPKDGHRQNISHIFVTVLDFAEKMDKFPSNIQDYKCKETAKVEWMRLLTFYETYKNYDWAFHHDETIINAIKFFNKNFERK
jgi:8-oxo-dGTP pyrophosphatase MutT (NUDIX family)